MESSDLEHDPVSSQSFPKTMKFMAPESPMLTMIGTGVHTLGISLLKVQTHAQTCYADISDLTGLPAKAEERTEWLIKNRVVAFRLTPMWASFQRIRDEWVKTFEGVLAKHQLSENDKAVTLIYIKTLKDMTPDPELGNKTPLYVVSIPDIQLSMVQAMAPLDGKIRRTWIGTGYMIPFYERDHLGPTTLKSLLQGVGRLQRL